MIRSLLASLPLVLALVHGVPPLAAFVPGTAVAAQENDASPFRPSPAARELLDAARESRLLSASRVLGELQLWGLDQGAGLDPDLEERLLLLEDRTLGRETPLESVALAGALLQSLSGDPRLGDGELNAAVAAAAATLTQELLYRMRGEGHPLGYAADSLRAQGSPDRLPPPEGLPIRFATPPPPHTLRPETVLLERVERLTPLPDAVRTDWYTWIPGSSDFLARADGVLWMGTPGASAETLGVAGGPDSPPPDLSFSGEYVAAPGPGGELRVRRLGVAARGWWRPDEERSPVTALAFAPEAPEIAYAVAGGIILLHDLTTGEGRVLRDESPVADIQLLRWSPRGDVLLWESASAEDRSRNLGAIAVHGSPPIPRPDESVLQLLGPWSWAPDGVSFLGPARDDTRTGIWTWNATGSRLLHETPLGIEGPVLLSPNFRELAFGLASDPSPAPWGWNALTPFAWIRNPVEVLELQWGETAGRALYRSGDVAPRMAWSPDSRWLVRAVDERTETLEGRSRVPLRQGLWALDLASGDDVPLTFEPGDYRDPRFSSGGGWLLYLKVTEDGIHPRGQLVAQPVAPVRPVTRLAERMFLRALPLVRTDRLEEAALHLRDALRMAPDLAEVRQLLSRTTVRMGARSEIAAEAGLLFAAASRELVWLHAADPGDAVTRRELAEAFAAQSVIAGRVYAAEAASRARAFLEADPQARATPEQVRDILQSTLFDAVMWDPGHPDGWRLLENGMRHYTSGR